MTKIVVFFIIKKFKIKKLAELMHQLNIKKTNGLGTLFLAIENYLI